MFPDTAPRLDGGGGSAGVAGAGASGGTGQTGGAAGGGGTAGAAGASGGNAGSGGDAGGAAGCGGTQNLTLNSASDTYIESSPPQSTHGPETFVELLATSTIAGHRALVRFDLTKLPAKAKVSSAKLDLTVSLFESATHDVGAHRATQDWVEADTSWNKFSAASAWVTPGGDFAPTPTSHLVLGPTTKVGAVVTWDVTADVKGVVAGSFGNNGWLFKDDNEAVLKGERLQFASREAADPISRPKLRVTYSVCP